MEERKKAECIDHFPEGTGCTLNVIIEMKSAFIIALSITATP